MLCWATAGIKRKALFEQVDFTFDNCVWVDSKSTKTMISPNKLRRSEPFQAIFA